MFGLFKSEPLHLEGLGPFVRSRGLWRGTISLGSSSNVPLALHGSSKEPDVEAAAIARSLVTEFDSLRPSIERELFEHYQPHSEAVESGEQPSPTTEDFPRVNSAPEVWGHVSLDFACVTPFGNALVAELGYTTEWDEEHTLGARIQDGRLVELCGSILKP
jgi:hypothetical protein